MYINILTSARHVSHKCNYFLIFLKTNIEIIPHKSLFLYFFTSGKRQKLLTNNKIYVLITFPRIFICLIMCHLRFTYYIYYNS